MHCGRAFMHCRLVPCLRFHALRARFHALRTRKPFKVLAFKGLAHRGDFSKGVIKNGDSIIMGIGSEYFCWIKFDLWFRPIILGPLGLGVLTLTVDAKGQT